MQPATDAGGPAEQVRPAADRAEVDRLVAEHGRDMVRLCYVICGDAELARDAAQDAWQRYWATPPVLRDGTTLRAWLLTVAANRAREIARRARRGAVLEQRAAVPAGERDPGRQIERLDLVRALDRLDPAERELIGLRYLLGLTSPEIGSHLGLSAEGARSRLHRIVTRLREELDR